MIRKHIIFYGDVQGVGFRYRAYHAARACGVSGWVRNLPDGSVEAELEGEEKAIDEMIMMIERGSYIRITDMSVRSMPVKGSHGFDVKD
ncbi:MAG: acylphosphatase [Oscillospiraceae bacterium]|nr:acylphosphatase [Oscillospiraceae bacterium]